MLRCVAGLCFAAFVVGWPACAGSDTDTFWDTPSAAALALASANALDPVHQQAADNSAGTPHDQAGDKTAAPFPNDTHIDVPQQTAMPDLLEPTSPSAPVSEPFNLATVPVAGGGIVTKWNGVTATIRTDSEILARCRDNMQSCSEAARNFLSIVAQGQALTGRARLGVINRAVNMAIEPMSDMAQWGVPDRWSDPLETFTTGRGDCEDYAIAKYVALTAAGVPAQDVKLVVVRNTAADEDHAVVAVHNDGDWIILDNRWLTMVDDVEMPKVIPLFVLDDGGVREFVAPTLTVSRQSAAPASIGF
jgi:predicted transglutaminase-like cysteine proteinase